MPIDVNKALADIDSVLAYSPPTGGTAGVSEVAAVFMACIERWAPAGSSYRNNANKVDLFPEKKVSGPGTHLRAVVRALRRDSRGCAEIAPTPSRGYNLFSDRLLEAGACEELSEGAEVTLIEPQRRPSEEGA